MVPAAAPDRPHLAQASYGLEAEEDSEQWKGLAPGRDRVVVTLGPAASNWPT